MTGPTIRFCLIILQSLVTIHSLTSYIVVYIQPPSVTNITATCWSNTSSGFTLGPRIFSRNDEFSWSTRSDYSVGPYDAYWCRATMGNSILTKFSVLGDGMPRNSSEWLINSIGRRRISLESVQTNDCKAIWNTY